MAIDSIENGDLNIRLKKNNNILFNEENKSEELQKEEIYKKYLLKKKNKFKWQLKLLLIGLFVVFCFLFILNLMVELDEILESGKIILKIKKDCSTCSKLDIIGDSKYIKFEYEKNTQNNCVQLIIQCGLSKGTEVILQWYNGNQNVGVSFMEYMGQSNIRKKVNCNKDGQYELKENEENKLITAIECIVAISHEEL